MQRTMIRLACCSALLLLLSLPARAAEPLLGNEVPVSPPHPVAKSISYEPSVAAGEDGFFVVWRDYSDTTVTARVLGARLSRDGAVLDPNGILLTSRGDLTPSVRWDGDSYVVSCLPPYSSGLNGQAFRITPDGGVTEVAVPIQSPPRSASGETIETNPFDFFFTLYFTDANGIRRHPVVFNGLRGGSLVSAVPLENDDWAVLYFGGDFLQWARINHDGLVATSLIGLRPVNYKGIVTDGSRFVIAWDEASNGATTVGYVTLDARTGAFQYERTVSMHTNGIVPLIDHGRPAIVWESADDGWNHEIRLFEGSRVITLDRFRSAALYAQRPAVAAGAGGAIVWTRSNNILAEQSWEVTRATTIAARVFDDFEELDDSEPIAVWRPSPMQRSPQAVAGANGTFIAWRESEGLGRIVAKFIPTAGGAASELAVSTTAAPDQGADAVAVAATPQMFIVAWRELQWIERLPLYSPWSLSWIPKRTRVFVRRYDAQGRALDTEPLLVADQADGAVYPPGGRGVSVVADDAGFVVAWIGEGIWLYGRRVPFASAIAAPTVLLSTEHALVGPQLLRAGGRTYVLWSGGIDNRREVPKGSIRWLKASRLGNDLAPSAPITVLEFSGVGEIADLRFTAVANEKEVLFAYSTRADIWLENGGACLKTRRFSFDLRPLDEQPQTLACNNVSGYPMNVHAPAAAWDGERWWVAAASTVANEAMTIWRLESGAAPLTLAAREAFPATPALVRTPNGIITLYSRLDPNGGQTWRLFLRSILSQVPKTRSARH